VRILSSSVKLSAEQVRDAVRALYPAVGERPPVTLEGYRRRYADWILFDGGCVILHLFSKQARETWSVEEHYLKGAAARETDALRGVPHPFFSTQARGPASNAEVEGL
jgi:ribosomal silencing factor RsfS